MERFTRNSYPGILCATVILLLTGLPGSSFPHIAKPIFGLDKVVHFLMFATFTFVTLWGYRTPYTKNGKNFRIKALWITLGIGAVLGILTELIQAIPVLKRSCSIYDWIADFLGSTTGIATYYFFHQKRK